MKTLSEIKTVNDFMEMLNWDLDENGMMITDWMQLKDAVRDRFPELVQPYTSTELLEN
jgi:hypothetical protein